MGFRKNSIEYPGYKEQFDVHNQNIYTNLTYIGKPGQWMAR